MGQDLAVGPAGTPRATTRVAPFCPSSADVDALVNDLTVAFAHEAGALRATLRLIAPDARHGRYAVATLDARWLTSQRKCSRGGCARCCNATACMVDHDGGCLPATSATQ